MKGLRQKLLYDSRHIWHPYTSMISPLPCYHVKSASGVSLQLSSGETLIDGMASWWSAIHGYNHPHLNKAAHNQIDKMSHVMFGGITHDPAIDLCKQLLDMTDSNLTKVFLADSGSVAVEVALKMAMQYWHSKGEKQRKRFLTIKHGYHGDTFGAMGICDPVNSMHSIYTGYLPQNLFAEAPHIRFGEQWDEKDISSFKAILERNSKEIAAVVIEPILQGAGGMRMYHPQYLKSVSELCKQHGVLLILDEIATGFGRTGRLFAYEHAGICPDILCLGKALTGGYLTMSAVLTNDDVAETVSSGESGCFMHGPTFMANPLAAAIASASLELVNEGNWKTQVKSIEDVLKLGLNPLSDHPKVQDVRILGGVGVIEMKNPVDMARCQKALIQSGVWLRPFGKLIYTIPPYIVSKSELLKIIDTMGILVDIN
ncbi:Adenosylmethionine-8-amino-7-oxononanoate aminotransferase (7,8-diamino-pelargonic acid aminotransferase) (DAPA aminotransferase) [Scheffersomyces stipitis CBS 6054]|uniref:Adenosylmethionine-8-amino-7-oxononanoate aminotransferase (7,8-diamino-pelargonic acid aminotransferase) (DAPA aminotransferase) n=1 Tax=Scheffersomyces stipitis (strain ATCC 58785 / CBS 6054 / NBRC 10063 / NRRL Y-11545) TaxID=322104 RepID=A3GF39_PICST|nr:Adenosylmethionine-8-amino-7-oxononanoate aminotransferase (7,8-diamino-pelargonic acid aminotransferase) (DAPA aminotransferase) [Scheffersomyces stipitis CBS 6054]EAZ63280.2 Adenosylmethionine-8-amino-7-oxononanoate aminotransferase (7,8-diamino-pelargonic acid aminotransferase) (DAPA aminotransferase) [Scheffersomyces stipitis CBS 6054]